MCLDSENKESRWWERRARSCPTKKSVSGLDQLQSILQQVCNKSDGMCLPTVTGR